VTAENRTVFLYNPLRAESTYFTTNVSTSLLKAIATDDMCKILFQKLAKKVNGGNILPTGRLDNHYGGNIR